ncbi:MAG: DNA polymerase III subunit delta [Candidatus Omnitrophota bacterium]
MSPKKTFFYFLIGDPFLTRAKADLLAQDIRKTYPGGVEDQVVYLSDHPADELLARARNLPFLAEAQIFRVREAERLKAGDLESFQRYAAKPAAHTYFLFEILPEKNSGEVLKKLCTLGTAIQIETTKGGDPAIRRYIQQKTAQGHKTIEETALGYLEQAVGAMPSFLDSMIEKLMIYAGEEKHITLTMAETFYEDWNQRTVFDLANALADQRTEEGFGLLHELISDFDRDFFAVVGILHWQFRRFWQLRVLLDEGVGQELALRRCRFSPKQSGFAMRQVRNLSREKLERAIEGLFRLDWGIKSGQKEPKVSMETWLLESAGS